MFAYYSRNISLLVDHRSLTADHLWWTARGDFLPPEVPAISLNRSVSSQDNSEVEEKDEEMESRKTAQFTEYSISSSVVPRNKGMMIMALMVLLDGTFLHRFVITG